jgi:putative restriction endonuclease
MPFEPKSLELGRLYSRTELYRMWGYAGIEAISRGVVTPTGSKHIILFVTRQKQQSLTQYRDFISGDQLHWEGEKRHGSDRRIARAAERGDEVHLFYRDIHHTPFRYHGQVLLLHFIQRRDSPSQFTFRVAHDLSAADDLELHAGELASLPETTRVTVVRARVGQGQFRQDLLELWRGCAVTGVEHPELLRASHIKPWRSSTNAERMNKYNGLLLLPQYDHLFDRGYITFDEKGRLEPSPAIVALPPERLGIDMAARLRLTLADQLPFLEHHRAAVFLKKLEAD